MNSQRLDYVSDSNPYSCVELNFLIGINIKAPYIIYLSITDVYSYSIEYICHNFPFHCPGCRVIILNMVSDFAWPLMYQALEVGLMEEGFVWLVTDGVTMNQLPAGNISAFTGLLGTRPTVSKSTSYSTFFGKNDKPSVSKSFVSFYSTQNVAGK